MFCAPVPVFGGTERAGSSFHVLRSRTRYQRYPGRRVQFSRFALPDAFSTEMSALGPVFMFCTPVPVLIVTKGAVSNFHLLRS
jgi:hypothetical protein